MVWWLAGMTQMWLTLVRLFVLSMFVQIVVITNGNSELYTKAVMLTQAAATEHDKHILFTCKSKHIIFSEWPR